MRGIGLIGTGRHGSRYAKHILNDIEGLELKAISRRSTAAREQAATWGARWYTEWLDLIADPHVEAVISVVPPSLNYAIAKACAREGKPLLLEKPLATDGREAKKIVEEMAAARCPLTVAQTLRYNPVITHLKAEILRMGCLYSFTANQRLEPSTLAWHDKKELAGSGVVIHTAVHVFDALRYITGLRVEKVMATTYRRHSKNLEDLVLIMAQMEKGVVGTVDVSRVSQARSGRYEFICRHGHLYGDQVHLFVDEVCGPTLQHIMAPKPTNTILALLQDWNEFLDGKRGNPVPGEEGLYAVEVCDACLLSAEEGRWITL